MHSGRRQFLKGLIQGATGLAVLAIAPPIFSMKKDEFSSFMDFSRILTAKSELDMEFARLCWRYVQHHVQLVHINAMHQFLNEPLPLSQTQLLENNNALQFIARHTLMVWYKGDLSSIPHTKAEGKMAYLKALQWQALGIPAPGTCVGNWSQACLM